MKKQVSLILFLAFFISNFLIGQTDDPILFTVENTPVHLSEFKYIYAKTNGKKADYSKSSLDEYLDLYVKFKLKVKKARDMKLDTIPALIQELAGYRRQLADSYLIDKQVTEKLIREVYERKKKDIALSHIMLLIPKNAKEKDIAGIELKAKKIKEQIEAGASFEKIAKQFSEDKSTKNKGGKIGYITAMLPNGFYDLETAAYNLKDGALAGPIRTAAGFHIIRKDGERPARGEIEVAHILSRDSRDHKKLYSKEKMEGIYKRLQAGENFEELAKTFSEDKKTAAKGGYIGFFGINRYEHSFEEAAFALKKDGDFSPVFKTAAGWHIVKRISKRSLGTYKEEKAKIQAKIRNAKRFELAKKAMIEKIKKEAKFVENKKLLDKFTRSLKPDFVTHKWKANKTADDDQVLVSFGNEKIELGTFKAYLKKSSRNRMRFGQKLSPEAVAKKMYNSFVDEHALKYEEKQLEQKYPEFKSLMREYDEGILLFEATKRLVWDKASQDEEGLKAFYKGKEKNYMWGDRAKVSIYTLSPDASALLPKLRKLAARKSPKKVLKKINKKGKVLKHTEKTYEKGKNKVLDALPWKVGSLSAVETNKRDKSLNFMKIEKVIPPMPKQLNEARGYVVADYQDYLEKQWVKELKNTYKVVINKNVFESMVK
ncbi:MAG TPA: peptidyl-prolyl cis-trans isomerase [Saprospiraceae bacterium]|nr:peptidyl-prolyl cis-trans isomerase [Saprospiraceae bacterium]